MNFFIVAVKTPSDGIAHMTIHREQIRAYFAFDIVLRSGQGCPPFPPYDYRQFCDAYAREATTNSPFEYLDVDVAGNPKMIKNRRSPTFEEVLGPGITDFRGAAERQGRRFK